MLLFAGVADDGDGSRLRFSDSLGFSTVRTGLLEEISV